MNVEEYAKMHELEGHYWWFVARRNLAIDLLRQNVGEKPLILDVGCGTGAVGVELRKLGTSFGIDFSEHALAFSLKRGAENIFRADAEHLPFVDASFDAVVSLDTIEHVPNDALAVSEIFRVLKPGGVFVMNVPAYKWLWGPHDVALMHQRRYTARQVRNLLTSQGFKVQRLTYSVFLLFPIVVARRLLERFLRGPAEVRLPPVSWVWNQRLIRLMGAEARILLRSSLPWGSSVVCVARRPGSR